MRKSVFGFILLLIIFSFFGASYAFTQQVEEADVYYVNVKILKIFSHPKGFYVIYRRAGLKTAEVFIPHSWTSCYDGRAKVERVNTMVSPYLSFFIKDGKFDHIKIAAPQDLHSPIWGSLRVPKNYDEKFEGVETLDLKF